MTTPDVLVTVDRGLPKAVVRRPGIVVEVRDYDIHAVDRSLIWKDEEGRRCMRLIVGTEETPKIDPIWADSLQRFSDDLAVHCGLTTKFHPYPKPERLHILAISGVEFFFNTDGSGYDGWGRPLVS